MKVILLKDVKKQGKKDDVIDVSDGFATNYLIKNNLAVAYSKKSADILNEQLSNRKHEEEKLVQEYMEVKKQLTSKIFTFKVKTGSQDKVFGNISTKQIVDELRNQGFIIPKKAVIIDHNLDTLGIHEVEIKLHKLVDFKIKISLEK